MLRLGMRTSSIFNSQHVATRCNRVAKRMQHVALNNVAICCVQMLRSFGWSFANAGPTMLGCVALRCCYRLAGALATGSSNILPQKRKTKIEVRIPVCYIVQKRKTKKGDDFFKSVVQSCGKTK